MPVVGVCPPPLEVVGVEDPPLLEVWAPPLEDVGVCDPPLEVVGELLPPLAAVLTFERTALRRTISLDWWR